MSEHRRNRMKQYKDCAEPSIIQGWNHTQIIICSADHHLKEGEKMEMGRVGIRKLWPWSQYAI